MTDFSTFPNGGPSVPTEGSPFGLQVTYSDWLWVLDHGEIYEETDGRDTLTDSCIYGGCAVNVEPNTGTTTDWTQPRTRTFEVVLYTDRNQPYGNTTLVVHERRIHFGLTGDFDWEPGVFHVSVSGSIGNTGLNTVIYADGREVRRCDVWYSDCTTPVTSGATYYAEVEDSDGNVYGITPSYLATSSTTGVKETQDKVDLPRLGTLFATTTDVCNTLLSYPGTHEAESSASDQWLACDAAVTNSDSMIDLLRAVALAGGGTGVLWWLEHQVTVQDLSPDWPTRPWPDDQVPAIGDLPKVWQGAVINVADHYMLQSRGTELTQAKAEAIAAACLWNVSRMGANARTDCVSMPVFVTGSDVSEATAHDLEAIVSHPEWAMLNYEQSGAKNGRRNWYTSVAPCDVSGDPGQQCDEYPFWASEQGGPLAPITPSLRYIDGGDNVAQGGAYGAFVTSCGLRTGTPQEGANAIGGTGFLVIPAPAFSSTYLCNRG